MHRMLSPTLLMLALIGAGPAFAQADQRCTGSPCVRQDVEIAPASAGRTSIAINPANAQQIVIGNAGKYGDCSRGAVHFSADRGRTWRHSCTLPGVADDEYSTEAPAVAFDHEGALVAVQPFYWSDGAKVWASRSTDGGQTWDGWYTIGSSLFYDSWIKSVHLEPDTWVSSPYRGRLYASFTDDGSDKAVIRVGHSDDGGRHWQTVGATPVATGQEMLDFGDLAVGRDGGVYLSYLSCTGQDRDCHGRPAEFRVVRSGDGGKTWGTPTVLAQAALPPGQVSSNLWYSYGALPDTKALVSFTPVIAIDNSGGPHQNRLFTVLTTYADKRLQVLLSTSDDQGASWSAPHPVVAGPRGADQFMPWVSVSRQGVVAVTWMDQRKHPQQTGYQPMVAFSTDGGASFTAPGALQGQVSQPEVLQDLDGLASHAWSAQQLNTVFVGPDAAGAPSLRLTIATPQVP